LIHASLSLTNTTSTLDIRERGDYFEPWNFIQRGDVFAPKVCGRHRAQWATKIEGAQRCRTAEKDTSTMAEDRRPDTAGKSRHTKPSTVRPTGLAVFWGAHARGTATKAGDDWLRRALRLLLQAIEQCAVPSMVGAAPAPAHSMVGWTISRKLLRGNDYPL